MTEIMKFHKQSAFNVHWKKTIHDKLINIIVANKMLITFMVVNIGAVEVVVCTVVEVVACTVVEVVVCAVVDDS
jgi:hypothetical protein